MPQPIEFAYWTFTDSEGLHAITVEIPTVYTVCTGCNGEGKSSAYLGVITEEDEQDDDWMDDYMHGRFDKPCKTCNGLRVESIMDEAYLSAHPDIAAAVDRADLEELEYRRTCKAERDFGA